MSTRSPITELHRDERGAIMAEAALVVCVLVVFLILAPQIHTIWVHQQMVRTEAHRDAFDKATGPLHWPEPSTSSFYGLVTEQMRGHPFPQFPPPPDPRTAGSSLSTDDWEDDLGLDDNDAAMFFGDDGQTNSPPDDKDYFYGFYSFPQGFPNQYVEGWQWDRFRFSGGMLFSQPTMEATRYAAVIRSPWTWYGWPFVPTQDIWPERSQITSFWGNIDFDDDVAAALGLLDYEIP